MLVIRLARTGRTKYPTYRLVAAESSRAATGKFVAVLGHYNPHSKDLVIKKDEIEKYLSNGAQPSNTVIKLLKQEKVKLPDWVKYAEKNKKPKKPEEAPADKPVEPAADADEAAEPTEAPLDDAPVAEAATEEAATKEEAIPESAPEDTADGEAAQAEANTEAVAAAGDAAIETAKEEAAE